MADAGEVACGTPELLWAARSCANNKKVREKQVLSDEQRGGFFFSNLNVCMYVCTELDPSLVVSHSRKKSTGSTSSTGDVTFVSTVLCGDELGVLLTQQREKRSSINSPLSFHPQARLLFGMEGEGFFFLLLPLGVSCLSAC